MRPRKNRKRKTEERIPTYAERFEKRFDECGGRLFMADLWKSRVLGALCELMAKRQTPSCLCIVKDHRTAEEMGKILFAGKDVTILKSVSDLLACVSEMAGEDIPAEDTVLRRMTEGFAARYPALIVCFEENGAPVLHAPICMTRESDGVYGTVDASHYCISDFLIGCGYGMTVLDDVYPMMDFRAVSEDHLEEFSPLAHELLSYDGKYYVNPVSHSYKRLVRLADSGDHCVILSDILMDRTALNLYAVMNLLHPSLSYRKAKKHVWDRSDQFSFECDETYASLSFAVEYDSVLSMCLHTLSERDCYSPDSIDRLNRYFKNNFAFLSREEVFVTAVYSLANRMQAEGAFNSEIIRYIEEDAGSAAAFCDLFFNDPLKGKMEKYFNFYLNEMEPAELLKLQKFAEEGGCFAESPSSGVEPQITYLYHDESSFEDLLRCDQEKLAERFRCGDAEGGFDRHPGAYSVIRHVNEDDAMCVCIRQIVEDQGLGLPLLVVTNRKESDICSRFSEMLPGTLCSTSPSDLLLETEQRPDIVIVDYDHFRALPLDVAVKTVLFMDGHHNIELFHMLVKKAGLFNNGNVAIRILVSYRNLSGHMADFWASTVFRKDLRLLPMDNADLSDSVGERIRYEEIMREIEDVYCRFRMITEFDSEKDLSDLADRYRSLTVRFPIRGHLSPDTRSMQMDLSFLREISAAYRQIYSHSATVGSMGYETSSLICKKEPPKGNKRAVAAGRNLEGREEEIFEREEQGRYIEFNVCADQAMGRCDVRCKDCGDCPAYQELLLNRFDLFAASVEGFFEKLLPAIKKAAEKERRLETELIVNGTESRAEYFNGLHADISFRWEKAQKILENLKEQAKLRPTLFFADYGQVSEIRRMVRHSYLLLFGEYYAVLMEIVKNVSEQMKTAFETAGQAEASGDAGSATT